MKSPAMSTPRKDPIPDQYINRLINEQDPSLPPIIEKYPPEYKIAINYTYAPNITEDEPNDSTDNSRNEKLYSVNKLKVTSNEDNDD